MDDDSVQLRIEDQVFVPERGWLAKPRATDVVTAVRRRYISEWETTQLKEGEKIPKDVLKRIRSDYEDKT